MKIKVTKNEGTWLLTNVSEEEQKQLNASKMDEMEEEIVNISENVFNKFPNEIKTIVFSTEDFDDDNTYNNVHGQDFLVDA